MGVSAFGAGFAQPKTGAPAAPDPDPVAAPAAKSVQPKQTPKKPEEKSEAN